MGMLSHVILRPRITEKSTDLVLKNAYVFDIDPRSNKVDVLRAIEEMYKVKPVRVNVVNLKQKKVVVRGRRGVKAGGKKAIVYLKKGDKIEFV